MPNTSPMNNPSEHKAYVITGPTSGIGRATVLEVSKHGRVVLVGRDREKPLIQSGNRPRARC
jgi:NAD(P)-dependent dehydrogenase (short-subunit alcohol dehydrogenase family)